MNESGAHPCAIRRRADQKAILRCRSWICAECLQALAVLHDQGASLGRRVPAGIQHKLNTLPGNQVEYLSEVGLQLLLQRLLSTHRFIVDCMLVTCQSHAEQSTRTRQSDKELVNNTNTRA